MVNGDSVMEIRKIPIDKINPAPYNPRKDLQPQYVDIVLARWEQLTGQKAVKLNE